MKTKTNYDTLLIKKGVKKILLIMKLTMFLIILTVFQVSATSIFSQGKNISLDMQNVTIRDVIVEIETQGKISFFYNDDLTELNRQISVSFQDKPIKEVLENALAQADMTYEVIKDNFIVLIPAPDYIKDKTANVVGQVSDNEGNPLPGVNITIKGTTSGTITNLDGEYSIPIPENATLVFSFVGMKTQEIAVNGQSSINIIMEQETIGIEDVVVIGYGKVKRRDLVGSIAKITSDDISKIPATSLAEAMQGMASGLFVGYNSGHPGVAPIIKIRGTNSINLNTDPLWIVDGVPINTNSLDLTVGGVKGVSPISMLNPNDIESIEVLKDAIATAIYGNRGSNGVILVTTKSSKANMAGMSIYYDGGLSQLSFSQNDIFVNSETWWNLYDKAWSNLGNTSEYQPSNTLDVQFVSDRPTVTREEAFATNTDHLGALTQKAQFHQVGLTANKGFGTGGVMFTMNYRDEKGLIKNNDLKRLTSRINFNFSPAKSLKIGINTNFSYLKNTGVKSQSDKGNGGWANWKSTLPWYKIYDESSQTGYWAPSSGYNMVAFSDENLIRNDAEQFSNISNAFIEWSSPIQGLSIKSEVGAAVSINNSSYWQSVFLDANSPFSNEAAEQTITQKILNYNAYLNYNQVFGQHSFLITTGAEATRQSSYIRKAEGIQIYSSYPELINPLQITDADGYLSGERYLMGIFGRFNYKYKDRYILNTSIRYDGHSALSTDNRWAIFPAVGIGWIITDEKFINIPAVNLLKLRASYGITGNTDLSNEMTQINWGLHRNRYGGSYLPGGTTVGPIGNSNLKWETTSNMDVGVDFGLFNNRISGSIAYYSQQVSDLILKGNIPVSIGFNDNQVWENVGDLKNWGWEFNVFSVNINSAGFKWETNFNISFNDNKIIRLNEFEKGKGNESNTYIRKEGEKLDTWYLANYVHVDPEKGIPMIEERDNELWDNEYVTESMGNLIPMNKSNTSNNRMVHHGKSTLPTFYGGITNNFSYKNFDLHFLFSFAGGHYLINDLYSGGTQINGKSNLVNDLVGNTWEKPGDIAKYPQLFYGNYYKYDNDGNPSSSGTNFETSQSDFFLEKGDYIRLRSLQFGYTLPASISSKVKLHNVRIYVGGTNLLLFTKYNGLDPETQSDLPLPRSVNLGLSFNL
jgi:TonB-linked SusC/RagA family outer membrane protein